MRGHACFCAMLVAAHVGLLALSLPGRADTPVLPERRAILADGVDFPGGDLGPVLDTSLGDCEAICLADPRCGAFTYNSRAAACFPKRGVIGERPFAGAVSGRIVATSPALLAQAAERQAALGFLSAADLRAAAAARARADDGASAWLGAARRALADMPDDWQLRQQMLETALAASVQAWLRAGVEAEQRAALLLMGQALEALGRGRDALAALRLAQEAAPGAEVAAALARVRALYGFRVTGHEVESDIAEPRICVIFSEGLRAAGVEYGDYIQTTTPGLAAVADGTQLCLEGVRHGSRYSFTLRAGLPAANGESLAAPVALDVYVRDRAPVARFPGRGYLLPRTEAAALPVVTVNVGEVALVLRRVDERNLLAAMREGMFGRALDRWQEERLAEDVGAEVWRAVAEVENLPNTEVTTRLPLGPVVAGLEPGLYALSARVPGADADATAATQWFVVSDLALASMAGSDGLHVFVRALADAGPVAGARLQLVAADNGILAEAESDARGYARFAPGLMRGTGGRTPALLTVAAGARDFAFLDLRGPEFDLSDRGVEGRPAPGPVDIFLTTDRGAYRPGERVHLTALARDGRAEAMAGLVLTARLIRPDGMEYARLVLPDLGAGGHVGAFDLAPGAPRGAWRLALHADTDAPPLATATLLVEDFLPERIDFDLALPDRPLGMNEMVLLGITARFLYGAPGGGLAIEGEVALAPAEGLAGWPGFRFGRHDEAPVALREALPGGTFTDAGGRAELPLALPRAEAVDRPLAVTATVRLAEGSGRPVERRITRPFAAGVPLVGLRPLFEGAVPEGETAAFEVIGIGPDGAPEAVDIAWDLTRVETRYQWYQLHGEWNWEPVTRRSRVAAGRLALTGDGPARLSLPVDWGRYELSLARADGANAAASLAFDVGWHAPAGLAETPDRLEVGLDRPAYAAGETARLRLRPRTSGQVLVAVVSDRLIHTQTLLVEPGEVEVALPVTEDWGTGVYVTATLVRPMDAAAGQVPARAMGLAWAGVEPGERRLAAAFEVPAEAAPRRPLEVGLRIDGIAPGETAHATIAAVDLGVLNLTGFLPPDPEAQYFGQRRLGVALRDVYGRLIDGLSGAMGRIRQGGDAAPPATGAPPPDEAGIVSLFTGPLSADAAGQIRTSLDLPAFNGTLRLMAVVWSASGVGHAVADVAVRDPVVVSLSAPRFLAPGDESRLRLDLAHVSGPAGEMALSVTASGGLDPGPLPGVRLAEGGRATVEVPLRATAAGPAALEVALTTPAGEVLRQSLPLPVRALDPAVTRSLRFTLADGETFTLGTDVFDGLRPGTGRATLAAGPIARLDAPGLLAALEAFPYGCTEQVISRALPLVYHGEVARALGLGAAGDLSGRIGAAVREVLLRQAPSGAFGLWSPAAGDFWLDAYATDFLSRARAAGHAVPESAFALALDNLRNQVAYAGEFERGGEALAYALHVLAREGAAAMGDLRYYADVKADAFATPLALAQLGAALAAYGDQARADALFRAAAARLEAEAPAPPAAAPVWRADYGTYLRDTAGVLALAVEAGSAAVDRARLAGRLAPDGAPRSTQENLWSLMAAHALVAQTGPGAFLLDGVPVAGPLVEVLDAEAAGAGRAVTNRSGRDETLTLTIAGVPESPPPPGGRGYRIARGYYTPEGEPADPRRVALGTRLVAVLTITPLAPGAARLMVADPLPAGFEIDNPDLLTAGETAALAWLPEQVAVRHSEARADRFLAAVDWQGIEPFRLAYRVRAVSPGRFQHPAPGVEDMYRPAFRAHGETGQVTVMP